MPAPAGGDRQRNPDGVTFGWTNPDPQPGDSYDWQRTRTGAGPSRRTRVTDPGSDIRGVQQACIEVVIVRDNGDSSVRPANECVGQ